MKKPLYEKIIEILTFTQFAYWVEDSNNELMTAENINTQKERAIDYFLGKTDEPRKLIPYEQVKFRHIIELQAHHIMREIDNFFEK